MSRVVVIGYGNAIRGDDAMGQIAGDQLEAYFGENHDDVKVYVRHTITPELAIDLAEAELAVFIDTSEDGPKGEVIRRDVDVAQQSSPAMVHFLDPPALLHWARSLYGKAAKATIFSIVAEDLDFADRQLTPTVAALLPELVGQVISLIESHLATPVGQAGHRHA